LWFTGTSKTLLFRMQYFAIVLYCFYSKIGIPLFSYIQGDNSSQLAKQFFVYLIPTFQLFTID